MLPLGYTQLMQLRFYSCLKVFALAALAISACLAGCSSKKVVTEDYLNGFRVGQLASVSSTLTLGIITGEKACTALKNGINATDNSKVLVKPEAFEGCVAGFDAGITGKTPKIGDRIE